MRMRRCLGWAMGLATLWVPAWQSQAEGFALAFRASSTGVGAELTAGLSPSFNARVGGGGWSYDHRVEDAGGIPYDLSATLKSGFVALDWHPGGAAFRLSGGLLFQGNKATGVAQPSGTVTIGDTTYTGNAVGTLNAEGKLTRGVAPFILLGAGNGARGRRLFLSFEAGVAFTGPPVVTLTASRNVPGLAADLDAEASEVEEDYKWARFYPVISLGLGIRF